MELKKKFVRICEKNSVDLAYLFGSQADVGLDILNGKSVSIQDPLADLDLGIVLSNSMPSPEELLRLYTHLYNQLVDLFLPLHLDLVFLQEQHSVFRSNAVTGICIYSVAENLKNEYEEDVMRKAADFRPFLDRYLDEHLEEVIR